MAKSFELEGTLKHIYEIQTFQSGFSKREFVIETTDDRFPQLIKFECVKDKVAVLDSLALGDVVQVTFDIRGNEFKGKYYVNLNAWKISKAGGDGNAEPQAQRGPSSLDDQFDNEGEPSDDIPF